MNRYADDERGISTAVSFSGGALCDPPSERPTRLVEALLADNARKAQLNECLLGVAENLQRGISNLLLSLAAGQSFSLSAFELPTGLTRHTELARLLLAAPEPLLETDFSALQPTYDRLLAALPAARRSFAPRRAVGVRALPLESAEPPSTVAWLLAELGRQINPRPETRGFETFQDLRESAASEAAPVLAIKRGSLGLSTQSATSGAQPNWLLDERRAQRELRACSAEVEVEAERLSHASQLGATAAALRELRATLARQRAQFAQLSEEVSAAAGECLRLARAPGDAARRPRDSARLSQTDLHCSEEELCSESLSSRAASDVVADISRSNSTRAAFDDGAKRLIEESHAQLHAFYDSTLEFVARVYGKFLRESEHSRYVRLKRLIRARRASLSKSAKMEFENGFGAVKQFAFALRENCIEWKAFIETLIC